MIVSNSGAASPAHCSAVVHATSAAGASKEAESKLLGIAYYGEKVAAKIYATMAKLKPEYADLLRKFAQMEGRHAVWFQELAKKHNIPLDREFAERELGYLLEQVARYQSEQSFESLAIVQGFIVECMAMATYEPFLEIADDLYPGSRAMFQTVLDEERYHVEWVTRYLRLRFFDAEAEFTALAEQVNVQGVDCVGGSMMNIADHLNEIGLSGADCAGVMMDAYTTLLENVGIEPKRAAKNVVSLFMPLIRKYRHGESTK